MTLREMLRQVIVHEHRQRQLRGVHYGFHDAAGSCLRKLYLDRTVGPAPSTDLRTLFMAACGHAVGGLCEAAAMELGAKSQVPSRLGSADGHCDILVVGDEVIDVKVVGEASWEILARDKAPHEEHVVQVNGYAAAHGAPNWSLYYLRGISIYDRGELQWKAFHGMTNIAQAAKIPARWDALRQRIAMGDEPPVPKGFKYDKFPCAWCGHRDGCFPQEERK